MPSKGKNTASRIMYIEREKSLLRKSRLSSQSIYSLGICKPAVRLEGLHDDSYIFFRKFELIAHILKYSH